MLTLLAALALQTAAPTVVPDGGRLSEERKCFVLATTRDGASRPIGVTWQTVERDTVDGQPVLRIVVHQSVNGGAFDMRDAFVLEAASLRPISMINTRQGQVHVRLAYGPDRITGERIEGGVSTPINVPLSGPVWEGNLFGQTFAALPLAEGAEFALPYWQYDKGFGTFSVRVTGKETVPTPDGRIEAWVVEAGPDEQRSLTYLISTSGNRELGYRAAQGSQALGGDCSSLENPS
ncbi:hypothetical protein [Brevundimonas sp.]|uniref:DUF3108 domain-containing protein n=1 Tax=Brevundimonas sp. TaxID=1871086 RepID=UPI00286BE8C2|nr:hypothetical protein [Brevundimonas sp.]